MPSFELGLRSPLHPIIRDLLKLLNITLAELYPNAWGCVTTFLILCQILKVKPTLTAFRYILRARLCNFKDHEAGWVTFAHRRGYKIIGELSDNQKGFRTMFAFLYSSQPWSFKTSFDIKPNVNKFNNNVPQYAVDDAVIIKYALMSIEQGRKTVQVQNNWIPKRNHLNIKNLLSWFEISLKTHKRKYLKLILLSVYRDCCANHFFTCRGGKGSICQEISNTNG